MIEHVEVVRGAPRQQWDRYHELYVKAITATATEHAPWFVVPADRKWVRDVAVASILVATRAAMDPQVPTAADGRAEPVIQ